MTIVQAPGSTYIDGRRTAVEVKLNDFRGIATADNTLDFYVSDVKRLSPEAAEAVSYNILNASTSLYDRLDNDKPVVDSISVTKKGELKVLATDTKTQKYTSSLTYCYEPISEPANSGIVAYQITKSTTEPYTNWIEVPTTNSLDITTSAVEDNGTYYVWVLDVGGNTNYKKVVVSGINFDTTPPTLGTPKTKAYKDSIELEIIGATDESGISLYEFYLNGSAVASQSENKYIYTSLKDETEYTLAYKVTDTNGNSATSENITVTTLDITPPTLGTPATKIYEDSIELEITGATDKSGISLYEFYLNGNALASQSESKYIYTNLEDNTEYTLAYKVTDTNGNSATSNNIVVTTNIMKITETYTVTGAYISKIMPNTSLQNFMKNINIKVQGAVYTKEGQELKNSALVGTGMELRTAKKGNFVIVVTSDVTGDGKLTATDILKLKEKLVGLETFTESFDKASDVDYNEKVNITDLIKMKQALVGLINL